MIYLEVFKTAIFIFPFIAFFITIPFILIEYHKFGSINKLRVLIIYSFIFYLITIYFLVILPLPPIWEVIKLTTPKAQLIPFNFVRSFIRETPLVITKPNTYLKALFHPSFYTVFYNVLMTIPFGIYLRYYFKASLWKTIKYSFLLSLFFELTQLTGLYFIYARPYRLFDVDDLIMNTLGGVVGYYIMGKFNKFLPTRDEIDRKTLEKAKTVSGLRRITIFCLDLAIFIFFWLLSYIFIPKAWWKYVMFVIYFVVIPYYWNGFTIGSYFVNVRLTFPDKKILRLLIKSLLPIIYYIILPFSFMYGSFYLINQIDYTSFEKVVFILGIFNAILIYYIINIFHLLRTKRMFYDNFSKVEYINTIDEIKKNKRNSINN